MLKSATVTFAVLVACLCLSLTPVVSAAPGYEDYTTYTEVEPDNRIQATANHIDFTSWANETAYSYDDKGVDHFAGDFEHTVDYYCDETSATGVIAWIWALTNILDDLYTVRTTDDLQGVRTDRIAPGIRVILYETVDGDPSYDISTTLSMDTWYYFTVERDEAVGANGTLYCRIYDDEDRTSLVDTLTVTLNEKEDFRYIYACSTSDYDTETYMICDIEKLNLQEEAVTHNFHGEISTLITVAGLKTVNYPIDGSVATDFSIDSKNTYGLTLSIDVIHDFLIESINSLPVPIVYATRGFVLATIFIGMLVVVPVLVLALVLLLRKR